jgi:hypothetical protein
MQVLSSGEVPGNGFASRRCVLQNFHKSLTGEIIGVFGVTGVFKGQPAGGRYKLPQGLVDPVVLKTYLHAAILTAYKTGTIEVPRLVPIMFVIISVASAEPAA